MPQHEWIDSFPFVLPSNPDPAENCHTLQEAMVEAVKMAREEDACVYLYKMRSGNVRWGLSKQYWSDWLFMAWPGGRTQFSAEGSKLVTSSA